MAGLGATTSQACSCPSKQKSLLDYSISVTYVFIICYLILQTQRLGNSETELNTFPFMYSLALLGNKYGFGRHTNVLLGNAVVEMSYCNVSNAIYCIRQNKNTHHWTFTSVVVLWIFKVKWCMIKRNTCLQQASRVIVAYNPLSMY